MAILSKAGIVTGGVIEPPHVTQIIDALTASGSVIDISITGSLNVAGATRLGTLGTSTQSPLVFNPDIAGASVFYIKNNGGLKVGTGGNPYSGTDFFTFDGSGNANFGQNVNVAGNIAIGNTYPRLFFTDTDGNPDFSLINDNGNFIIYNDTNTRSDLFISSSGKIGINTFNTRAQLEVAGGIYTDGFTSTGGITISGSTTLFNNGGTLDLRGVNTSFIQWYPDNSTRRAYFGFTTSGSTNLILENETTSGNIALVAGTGFVGINKYTPTSTLDVAGDTIVTGSITATGLIASPTMTTSNFSSTNITANNATNVNTITTNFSASGVVTIGNPGASNSSYIQFWPNDVSGNAYWMSNNSSILSMGLGVSGSGFEVPMISVLGQFGVGIKKSNPNAMLDVNGNTIITGSLRTTGNVGVTGSLTTTGNVGIGTSTPNTRLAVVDTNYPSMQVQSSWTTSGQTYSGIIVGTLNVNGGAEMGFVRNIATATNSFYHITPYGGVQGTIFAIRPNGNIGIGTPTPLARLTVSNVDQNLEFSTGVGGNFGGGVIEYINRASATTNPNLNYLVSAGGNDAAHRFWAGSSTTQERVRIGATGTTSRMWIYSLGTTGNPTVNLVYDTNTGEIFRAVSSRIYKKDIVSISYGLKEVLLMNPVNYKYKSSNLKDIGFIADEMYNIVPEIVSLASKDSDPGLNEGEPNAINYDRLVAVLTKAIQEQQTQIEELKLQVATLLSGSIN